METFARIITACAAVFILLMIFERYLELDRIRYDNAENKIKMIYGNIKEKGFITASDMIELREAASLCRGSITISAGCLREVADDTGLVRSYREYLYISDIEQLINEEGSFMLSRGDTLSISIETALGSGLVIPGITRRNTLNAGGVI